MGEWYIASQTPENFAMDESAGQYGTLKNGVITFPAQGIAVSYTHLDLYAVPGEDAYTLPEGEYMASQLNEDHTFTSQYTGVQRCV